MKTKSNITKPNELGKIMKSYPKNIDFTDMLPKMCQESVLAMTFYKVKKEK